MKKIIIIVGLMVAAAVSAFGQTPDKKSDKTDKAKEQVMALATQFANALVKKDAVTMERILSVDYSDISPTGLPTTKSLLIDYCKVKSGNMAQLEAIDLSSSWVRLYDNTAVMITHAALRWRGANQQAGNNNYIVTLTAVKKSGLWQIVATHESEELAFKETETKK